LGDCPIQSSTADLRAISNRHPSISKTIVDRQSRISNQSGNPRSGNSAIQLTCPKRRVSLASSPNKVHGVTDAAGQRDVLWTIKARTSVIRCILAHERGFAELLLFQDGTLALSERLPDAEAARAHADRLRARLQARGWQAVS
jgi:hypothetical protein